MKLRVIILCFALGSVGVGMSHPPETHFIKVRANVQYRCFGGYDKKKIIKDSHTGMVCDNKEYRKTLIEKVVPIKIQVQPSPDNDQTLAGIWSEKVEFLGRRFEVATSLFKFDSKSKMGYRAQLSANEDGPHTRQTMTFVDFPSPKQMNPVTVRFYSIGTPEEISLEVVFEPAP